MRLFQCQVCGQALHFETAQCTGCGCNTGFDPDSNTLLTVVADGSLWQMAEPSEHCENRWRFCHNWELSACNWLVPVLAEDDPTTARFCLACRHNRTVPDLSAPYNLARWRKIEHAKRRLIYTLRQLGLPLPAMGDDHPQPLVFDFLENHPNSAYRIMTGHLGGVITIALDEADDATREAMRNHLSEAYRTLLGHFRHEIGHYYWDLLIRDGGRQAEYRALFGDDSLDYAAALHRHYSEGPPLGWQDNMVSAYATMHPWEDWAETWAHYLHIVDTLETAAAMGIEVSPPADEDGELSAEIDFNPYRTRSMARMLNAWLPLALALNMLNRSMGHLDLYPFTLPAAVQGKLAFVHDVILAHRQRS